MSSVPAWQGQTLLSLQSCVALPCWQNRIAGCVCSMRFTLPSGHALQCRQACSRLPCGHPARCIQFAFALKRYSLRRFKGCTLVRRFNACTEAPLPGLQLCPHGESKRSCRTCTEAGQAKGCESGANLRSAKGIRLGVGSFE